MARLGAAGGTLRSRRNRQAFPTAHGVASAGGALLSSAPLGGRVCRGRLGEGRSVAPGGEGSFPQVPTVPPVASFTSDSSPGTSARASSLAPSVPAGRRLASFWRPSPQLYEPPLLLPFLCHGPRPSLLRLGPLLSPTSEHRHSRKFHRQNPDSSVWAAARGGAL